MHNLKSAGMYDHWKGNVNNLSFIIISLGCKVIVAKCFFPLSKHRKSLQGDSNQESGVAVDWITTPALS